MSTLNNDREVTLIEIRKEIQEGRSIRSIAKDRGRDKSTIHGWLEWWLEWWVDWRIDWRIS
jgi:transposase